MRSLADRFLNPPSNVGGSDLVTRVIAVIIMLALTCVVVPQAGVTYPILKITLLCVSEVGLSGLTVGLFVKSKTYAAGLHLFIAPLAMLWLVQHQLAYLGAGIGLLSIAGGIVEIITRKSRINGVLGISTLRAVLTTDVITEALAPDPEPAAATRSAS